MKPTVIQGNHHQDQRGVIQFNNDFNALGIKRIYFLENVNTDFVRAWQGHKIEQRWFHAVNGSFKIKLIEVDDWENPSKDLQPHKFILKSENLDILHVPKGYISSIQSLEEGSKLMLLSDFMLGEVQDEYRFPADYFN